MLLRPILLLPEFSVLLGIAAGIPLLRIRQEIYSNKGKIVLYVLGLYRGTATLFLSGDSVSSGSYPSWKGEIHGLSNLTSTLFESSWRGRDSNAPAFHWPAGKRRSFVR